MTDKSEDLSGGDLKRVQELLDKLDVEDRARQEVLEKQLKTFGACLRRLRVPSANSVDAIVARFRLKSFYSPLGSRTSCASQIDKIYSKAKEKLALSWAAGHEDARLDLFKGALVHGDAESLLIANALIENARKDNINVQVAMRPYNLHDPRPWAEHYVTYIILDASVQFDPVRYQDGLIPDSPIEPKPKLKPEAPSRSRPIARHVPRAPRPQKE